MTGWRAAAAPDTPPEQAARWLARFAAGDAGAGERAALQEWLAADPAHRRAWGDAQATWAGLDALAGLASSEPRSVPATLRAEIERCDAKVGAHLSAPLRRSRARWIAAAAALLVAGGLGVTLLRESRRVPAASLVDGARHLETLVGERSEHRLADGSVVWLNTDTEVEVELSAALRSVHLVGGEAYFEVAKDPRRPFVVSAADRSITAVGTAFNVYSRDGETRVTVVEGKVEVARLHPRDTAASEVPSSRPSARPPQPALEAPRLVAAAQAAMLGEDVTLVAALPVETLPRQAAWRQGLLYFDGVTLKEIVKQLDPYLPASIVIADPSIEGFVGGGVVRVDSAESILAAITRVWPVDVRREAVDRIVLVRRR